jgi:redox-sensitive bicupin YhaK (pirin superfamily)
MDRRDLLKKAAAVAAAGAAAPLGEAVAGPPGPAPAPAAPRLVLRPAGERGHANHGWLDTWHTFSFASYMDRRHMGFRGLRVINDDKVTPGRGFPTHPHEDMEIVTYVLAGALQHKDTLGNGGIIRPGEVQRMSAGTGIRHSEYNPSGAEEVHFLQIWMLPDRRGHPPSYEQKTFPVADRTGRLRVVASPDGREGSVRINAPNQLFAAVLGKDQRAVHRTPPGRHTWIHVARGRGAVNGVAVGAGDGLSTSDAGDLHLVGGDGGVEVLLFDLA